MKCIKWSQVLCTKRILRTQKVRAHREQVMGPKKVEHSRSMRWYVWLNVTEQRTRHTKQLLLTRFCTDCRSNSDSAHKNHLYRYVNVWKKTKTKHEMEMGMDENDKPKRTSSQEFWRDTAIVAAQYLFVCFFLFSLTARLVCGKTFLHCSKRSPCWWSLCKKTF